MLRALEQGLGWIVGKTQEKEALKLTPIEQVLTHDGFKERVREAQAFVNANPLVPLDRSFVAWGKKGKGIFTPSFLTIDFQDLSDQYDEVPKEVINSANFKGERPLLLLVTMQAIVDLGPRKGFPSPSHRDLRRQHNINKAANGSKEVALVVVGIRTGDEKVQVLFAKEPQPWGFKKSDEVAHKLLHEKVLKELGKAFFPQEEVAILRERNYRATPILRIPSDTLEFSDRDFREILKAS